MFYVNIFQQLCKIYLFQKRCVYVPLFSSFSFSLQQIWTDWRKFLFECSKLVKLDECVLILTHWKMYLAMLCWLLFRTCDHYFAKFQKFIKTDSKAISQSSEAVVIESSFYCVKYVYTGNLQLFTKNNYN